MVKSMFAAISGLKAHQQMLDVIGNNIANVNTPGYKAGTISFQDAVYQTVKSSQAGNDEVGGYGGSNPSRLGYGVNVGSITYDFGRGGITITGRPMDAMIDGTGFFIVGSMKVGEGDGITTTGNEEGSFTNSGLELSRVGQFSVDQNGYLVDGNRNYVYGFATTVSENGEAVVEDKTKLIPLRIPGMEEGGDENSKIINSFTIKQDGTVVGTAEDKTTVTLGKIALAAVQNPNGLEKSSGYYYSIGDNCGKVSVVEAGGTTGSLVTEGLEMAKVELASEFSNMILAQRGFQANSKIITVTDEMLEQLVNMKR